MPDRKHGSRGAATRLVHAGRDPAESHGFVNPPVYHGSTVLYPDTAALKAQSQRYSYGRRGSPTIDALTQALNEMEGAEGTVLAPSGLAAVTLALLAAVKSGDHLLMVDSAYMPTRHFCDTALTRLGVEVEYYDPLVGAGVAGLIRDNTSAVFTESPGSQTFEMQDVPAIAEAAHAAGALVLMDNTWASPLFHRPLENGVDISIQAGTKYLVGHADAMLGTVSASGRGWARVKAMHGALGLCAGPDDIYLALRGLRSLHVRLERHMASALVLAEWLAGREEVARVLYPALPDDPGYAIWKRDFSGASGLMGVVLAEPWASGADAFLDALALFGLGYSWGGFESLAIPCNPGAYRTAAPWREPGALLRLHVGLEDPADLIADCDQAFGTLRAERTATR